MDDRPDAVRVTSPEALRGLSHPLRLRLLGLLRLEGPSTATLLGRRVGESSGATSYHLRELARFGFVGEVEGRGTGRERWWQALHRLTSWDVEDFAEEGSEVVDELQRHQVALRGQLLRAWQQQRSDLDQRWDGAASLDDYALRLRPEQAADLARELNAVARRWLVEHPPSEPAEGTELVGLLLDVLPVREWPVAPEPGP